MDDNYMGKPPRRKNIRLQEYDYSQAGYYFITICTRNKENLFWKVGVAYDRSLKDWPLSNMGEIVDLEINKIDSVYMNVEIDKYVIMPNHVHIIVILRAINGRSGTAPTISRVVQQFKGSVSKQAGFLLWQKSFYDHIIRNEHEYQEIWNYIETNPLRWEEDKYYI